MLSYLSGRMGYGEFVSESGEWAARLLILSLAVTPLRLIFKRGRWLVWLVRQRRYFGVATFGYATGHLAVYVLRKASPALMLEEASEPWLLAGWVAFVVLLALAVTSNDASVRLMRRGWKRLHRLVYLGAVLVFLHWTLSAFDPTVAYVHLAILVALETVRVALEIRQRVT
ncbi:MAG: ferric reductase-like transmembrane domain-containing protein [Devosia sp.]